MDVSAPGDTVLVAPGTYREYSTRYIDGGWGHLAWVVSCCFFANGVVLKSQEGPASTIIELPDKSIAALGYIVLVGGNSSSNMLIEGFTITGGYSGQPGIRLIDNGKVTIRDCIFQDIAGGPGGGAVKSEETKLDVLNCTFRNCTGGGAGIYHDSLAFLAEDCTFDNLSGGPALLIYGYWFWSATVRRCGFLNNTAGAGAGIRAHDWYQLTIEECFFEHNVTTDVGGALMITGTAGADRTKVRGCAFLHNRAIYPASSGGLIWLDCGGALEKNTFYGCSVENAHPNLITGAAFSCGGDFPLYMNGNVFAGSEGAFAVNDNDLSGSDPISACNLYWANVDGDYSGFQPDPSDLFADPLFCDPDADNFSVAANSSCLPSGNSCAIQIGAFGEGCGVVSIERESWGKIKERYRGSSDQQ